MILVGGLTDFADGNRATLVRRYGMNNISYRARLEDLLNDGDIGANAKVLPGDVLIIPEAFF
jgi:polysaccharide export outer membrane protein